MAQQSEPIDWDKDDDDALDFATSAANLRATIFNIPLKSRFDVKQMAGNIIPAIATTNAIIAGALILQAIAVLKKEWTSARAVWYTRTQARALNSSKLSLPNPACSTCRTPYIPVKLDTATMTLGTFLNDVVKEWAGIEWDTSLLEGSRIVYDADFDDNVSKTFEELDIRAGCHLQVNDDEGNRMPVIFIISK